MAQVRIRLKSISDSIPGTGVYGPEGEYPAGHEFLLPEGVSFANSGYAGRAELIGNDITDEHVSMTGVEGGADPDAKLPVGENPDPTTTGPKADDEPSDVEKTADAAYTVEETSQGWWAIKDGDGVQVGKKLRTNEAEAFKAMSADEQAKFAEGHSAAGAGE
jgi:hypothetical protein